ncbi:MAG: chemotaxis protein CheB [Bacteroidota bacterium]
MAQRKISCKVLVIGGSAGSLEVLLHILPRLKPPLPFPVVIIVHRKYSEVSTLATLLSSKTSIKVKEPEDKEDIAAGTVYLAPADYHLLVEDSKVFSLDYSEKVNYSRPSIDVTFETAAEVYRDGVVGVLLSGANSDGVEGLACIKKYKGFVIVQSPETAQTSYMPEQAVKSNQFDEVMDMDKMVDFINGLY